MYSSYNVVPGINHPQMGEKTTVKTTPGAFMPTFMGDKATPFGGYNHPFGGI